MNVGHVVTCVSGAMREFSGLVLETKLFDSWLGGLRRREQRFPWSDQSTWTKGLTLRNKVIETISDGKAKPPPFEIATAVIKLCRRSPARNFYC